MLRRKRIKKGIGQILVESKLITKEQLNKAIQRQKTNRQCLSRNLIDLGYVEEQKIAERIAEMYRIPYVSLDCYELSRDLLNVIPQDILRIHGLIPLDLIGDILTLGIVDALEEEELKNLEVITGFKIRIMVVTAGDFNRGIKKLHGLSIVGKARESKKAIPKGHVKTPLYEGKERRRFLRFDRSVRLRYEFKDKYNINSSVNISQGGLLIKSKSPIPVDSHIVARIELPPLREDIIIISRVVRVVEVKSEGIYLIALSYSSMDIRDSEKLSKFMETLKKVA